MSRLSPSVSFSETVSQFGLFLVIHLFSSLLTMPTFSGMVPLWNLQDFILFTLAHGISLTQFDKGFHTNYNINTKWIAGYIVAIAKQEERNEFRYLRCTQYQCGMACKIATNESDSFFVSEFRCLSHVPSEMSETIRHIPCTTPVRIEPIGINDEQCMRGTSQHGCICQCKKLLQNKEWDVSYHLPMQWGSVDEGSDKDRIT